MAGLLAKLKVEAKVWAATTAAFAASVVVSLLNAVQDNHALLGSLPGPLQAVILIVTFLAGYATRHTPRSPDGS
jgi:hypothetical protein